MCGRAGKMITTPNAGSVMHSPSELSVDTRSHYRYLLKLAIRQAIDDMIGILSSGDRKATAFLISEPESHLDCRFRLDARQAQHAGDCRLGRSCVAPLSWQGGEP